MEEASIRVLLHQRLDASLGGLERQTVWRRYVADGRHASVRVEVNLKRQFIQTLTHWQAERHFCRLRFTGGATILSFGHSMFTSLDSIGSAVGKRPI